MEYKNYIYQVRLIINTDKSMYDLTVFEGRKPFQVIDHKCRITKKTIIMPVMEYTGEISNEYKQIGEHRIYISSLLKVKKEYCNINRIFLYTWCLKSDLKKAEKILTNYIKEEFIGEYQKKINNVKNTIQYLKTPLKDINILWDNYYRTKADIKISNKTEFEKSYCHITNFLHKGYKKRNLNAEGHPEDTVFLEVDYTDIHWHSSDRKDYYIYSNKQIHPCMFIKVYDKFDKFRWSVPVWNESVLSFLQSEKSGYSLILDKEITERSEFVSEKYKFVFYNITKN